MDKNGYAGRKGAGAKRRRQAGFTIVEVLIACLLLAGFVGGFILSYIGALHAMNHANSYYRAVTMARNRIQRASSFDFNSLELLQEDHVQVDPDGNPSAMGRFFRTTEVSTNGLTPHTMAVTISVRYPIGSSTNLSAPMVIGSIIATRM